jgi:hypothetical protein
MLLKSVEQIIEIHCSQPFFGPKEKTVHDRPPRTRMGLRPSSRRAGRHFGPPSPPIWADLALLSPGRGEPSISADWDPTVDREIRRYKTSPGGRLLPWETLDHFTLLLPCFSRAQAAAEERPCRRARRRR